MSEQGDSYDQQKKKHYSNIPKEIRAQIVNEIVVEKKQLNELLPSTCKSIVNTYLQEGRIGKKERRIRKIKKITTVYNVVLNPLNPLESTIQCYSQVQKIVEPSLKSKKAENQQENNGQPRSNDDEQISRYVEQWLRGYESALQRIVQADQLRKVQEQMLLQRFNNNN